MKASDYIIEILIREGVTHIFEVCGGALAHLLDSTYGRSDIRTVSMHHEMAAAIAAEGYARASENIGVAMATSGPGATNLITGIGSCFFDSIPCLFITGQVNTYEYKFDKPVRQIGFQETDIVTIVRPITKSAILVSDPENVQAVLDDLLTTARKGRPGPVLLDIPLNIQRSDIQPGAFHTGPEKFSDLEHSVDKETLKFLNETIVSSKRPVILAGGGVRTALATNALSLFAHHYDIPVVVSLMGLDAISHKDPLFVGMIGTYGNRYANLTVANADLLIILGSRLDTRQTGTLPDSFARSARKIHVDIDLNELNNKIKVDYPFNMDIRDFLSSFESLYGHPQNSERNYWKEKIRGYMNKYPNDCSTMNNRINPYKFFEQLSGILPEDAIICTDVGQIQMWAAQAIKIQKNQRFLTQGGMASIGSSLPMAIGAAFAKPDRIVVVITGDGGFQLNIQELQTVYHHILPIKIILLNNQGYGMIRQFQEQYFNCRFQSSVIGYSNPDFSEVVRAYKIRSKRVADTGDVDSALSWLFGDRSPSFLELEISEKKRVLPKLAVNKPIEEQEPSLSEEELRSQMIIEPFQGDGQDEPRG